MKKINVKSQVMLGIVGLSMTLSGAMAFADKPADVTLTAPVNAALDNMPNGYLINAKPMIFDRLVMPFPGSNGDLFLPVKKVSEGLGYAVSWDASKREVTLKFNGVSKTFKYLKDKSQLTGYQLMDQDGRIYPAAIRLGSLYTSPQLFAESMNCIVISDQDNNLQIDANRYSPDEASSVGEVAKILQGKDGVQLLVKGSAFGQYGYSEISVAASLTKVQVKKSDGTSLKLSDIKVGDQIYVKYGKAVAESLPPIGQAEEIVLLKDEGLTEGKVYFKQASIEKHPGAQGIAAPIYQLRVAGTSDYVLTLAKDAVITDQQGNKKTFDDIKQGSVVRVYTAQFATMSYPAQTAAYRIIIK